MSNDGSSSQGVEWPRIPNPDVRAHRDPDSERVTPEHHLKLVRGPSDSVFAGDEVDYILDYPLPQGRSADAQQRLAGTLLLEMSVCSTRDNFGEEGRPRGTEEFLGDEDMEFIDVSNDPDIAPGNGPIKQICKHSIDGNHVNFWYRVKISKISGLGRYDKYMPRVRISCPNPEDLSAHGERLLLDDILEMPLLKVDQRPPYVANGGPDSSECDPLLITGELSSQYHKTYAHCRRELRL
jgi:hypothetical protein